MVTRPPPLGARSLQEGEYAATAKAAAAAAPEVKRSIRLGEKSGQQHRRQQCRGKAKCLSRKVTARSSDWISKRQRPSVNKRREA